jgi:hypothetical protein
MTMPLVDRFDVRIVTGSQGTNQPVYVGFCGREFLLDTAGNNFRPNKDESFTLGHEGNVLNADRNDPRSGQPLDLDDAEAFPTYLRLDGDNNWSVKSALLTAQAGSRLVAFERDCGRGLVLSSAVGQRLFLKKDDDFITATFGGEAAFRVFDIALTPANPDVVRAPFQARLEFRQNRTQVTAVLEDISGRVVVFAVTARQNGASRGSFDLATGRLELALPLRLELPPSPLGLGIDSETNFAMTTEAVDDLRGTRRDLATGDLVLVGSAVFANGDLRGKSTQLILTGRVSPIV